jgi:vitamin B12 transport system substrate-binding protein
MSCRKRPTFLPMTVAIKGTMLAALLCSFAVAAPAAKATGKKAVSLAPHLTELVYAAGAGDHLLGVSEGSNYPPAVGALPQVGSGVAPNVERIALLQPDVILAWGYKNSKDLYPALRKLNIPVHYQAPASLDSIIDDIEELGVLFGTQTAASTSTRELREILRSTRQRYQNAVKIKTFVLVSQEPLYTLGARSLTRCTHAAPNRPLKCCQRLRRLSAGNNCCLLVRRPCSLPQKTSVPKAIPLVAIFLQWGSGYRLINYWAWIRILSFALQTD